MMSYVGNRLGFKYPPSLSYVHRLWKLESPTQEPHQNTKHMRSGAVVLQVLRNSEEPSCTPATSAASKYTPRSWLSFLYLFFSFCKVSVKILSSRVLNGYLDCEVHHVA